MEKGKRMSRWTDRKKREIEREKETTQQQTSERKAAVAQEPKHTHTHLPRKSELTTFSLVTPMTPFIAPSDALATAAAISLMLVMGRVRVQVRSTTDTVAVGTRKDMPVSLPGLFVCLLLGDSL